MAALPARCSSVVPERVKKLTTEAGAAIDEASPLPVHLAHSREDYGSVAVHALWPPLQRSRQNRSEVRRLFTVDIGCAGPVPGTGGCLGAVDSGAPFDDVAVDFYPCFTNFLVTFS